MQLSNVTKPHRGCRNISEYPKGKLLGYCDDGWPIRAYIQTHPRPGHRFLIVVWEHPMTPVTQFNGRISVDDMPRIEQTIRRHAGTLLTAIRTGTATSGYRDTRAYHTNQPEQRRLI